MKTIKRLGIEQLKHAIPYLYEAQNDDESPSDYDALEALFFDTDDREGTKSILHQVNADPSIPWFIGYQEFYCRECERVHLALMIIPASKEGKKQVEFYQDKYVMLNLLRSDLDCVVWVHVENFSYVRDLDLDVDYRDAELSGTIVYSSSDQLLKVGSALCFDRFMISAVSESLPEEVLSKAA